MKNEKAVTLSSHKLGYVLFVAFCLMSVLPILLGIYVISLFMKPLGSFEALDVLRATAVTLLAVASSFLGYFVVKKSLQPVAAMVFTAKQIARGKLDQEVTVKGGPDELEDLSESLKTISSNAKELLEKVEKLSLRDKLTGLYNITYIHERLDEEIQRAIHFQRPCSFAWFVIDNFERCVSRYGTPIGDEVLKSIAAVFNDHLSGFDRAARIGKDEFCVIFPDKNKKKAIEIVERVQKEVEKLTFLKTADEETRFTLSAGISENPIDGVLVDEVYKKARARVKLARVKGNAIEAFD